jgi:hypothetical protein
MSKVRWGQWVSRSSSSFFPGQKVFHVVQHQQHLPLANHLGEIGLVGVGNGRSQHIFYRPRHLLGGHVRVGGGGQVFQRDKPDAGGVVGGHFLRGGYRQPGFANPPFTHDGDQWIGVAAEMGGNGR